MAKDKCGTCFYWLKAPGIPMLNQPSDGACRFMPPGLVYFMAAPPNQAGQVQVNVQGAFPPISSEGWCGQHKEGRGDRALAS